MTAGEVTTRQEMTARASGAAPASAPGRTRRRVAADGPRVIAHRGACGYRPEHTAEAYRLGVALGADAVEPDLVATADGVLVVRHENEISGTTDVAMRAEYTGRRTTKMVDGRLLTGWFTEDFTWHELSGLRARERVPGLRPDSARYDDRCPLLRFADVLTLAECLMDEADRPLRVLAEIKSPTYFRSIGLPLDELLEQELEHAGFEASADWLTIESFEKTFLGDVAGRGVEARRVYLTHAFGAAFDLVAREGAAAPTYAEELTPHGLTALAARTVRPGGGASVAPLLDGVSVNKACLVGDLDAGAQLVDSAHAAGLDILCFTLRPENPFLSAPHRLPEPARVGRWLEEFVSIMGTGVDGVFADHPDLALRAREVWSTGIGSSEG